MLRSLATRANRRQGLAIALSLLGLAPAPDLSAKKKKKKKCPTGWILCGGTCVDPLTNRAHCGQCYRVCPSTAPTCAAGACRATVQGSCTSDADCVPGQGLICNAVVNCGFDGGTCCVTTGRLCSADCDCCSTDICRNGLCQSPATPGLCRPSSEYTVSCPYRNSCCRAEYPYCCFDTPPGCCSKGYPYCCPPTPTMPDRPDGYCCRPGFSCCSTGCCGPRSQGSDEVISEPGVPRVLPESFDQSGS